MRLCGDKDHQLRDGGRCGDLRETGLPALRLWPVFPRGCVSIAENLQYSPSLSHSPTAPIDVPLFLLMEVTSGHCRLHHHLHHLCLTFFSSILSGEDPLVCDVSVVAALSPG